MDANIAYNEFLYKKRREKHLSKRKFAKFLNIPPLFYSYYENGYVKPGKKYVKRISDALGVDYSQYLEGVSSYPTPLPEKTGWFVKFYRNFLSKLYVRIGILVLLFASVGLTIAGFVRYNYTMNHATEFYNETYLSFVSAMREKGGSTVSLLHEMTRPEIHSKDGDMFVSISTSQQDYAVRSLTAYVCYSNKDENMYYIVPNDAEEAVTKVKFQYIDASTLIKYNSSFTRADKNSEFVFSDDITNDSGKSIKGDVEFETIKGKALSHINEINTAFTTLIKNELGMDYDFYNQLLIDHSTSATNNLYAEVSSLAMGIGGVVLTGGFLFAILFSIFFAESQKKKKEAVPVVKLADDAPISRNYKTPKKDIRFFPFVPETVYEIIGILLVFFGSVRIALYAVNLFSSSGVEQANFESTSLSLFMYFTVGMFLLYFIDFDIFLDDKRSLRNFFLYGIVFFGLYILEAVLIEYFSMTRGVAKIVDLFYVIPNNFSTIACYFGIMVFLFYSPKWMNTKKKTITFRCLSILPLAWILISTIIFQNYKKWGMQFNTWQVYFFNSERPQFSLLCCSYLVGLYFLRLFFKKRYGPENAARFFNGNKFYFMKNILACLIICVLSLSEYLLAHSSKGNKGLGGYWQIIYLAPMLLFYHPHFGRRNKPLDYFTLILYGVFFGIGYVIAAGVIISSLFLR